MAYRQQGGYGRGGGGGGGGYGGRGGGGRRGGYQQRQEEVYNPVLQDTLRIRDAVMRCMGDEEMMRACMQMLVAEYDSGKWELVRTASPARAGVGLRPSARGPPLRLRS